MRILRLSIYAEPYFGGKERHVTKLSRQQAAHHEVDLVRLIASRPIAGISGVQHVELPSPPQKVGSSLAQAAWYGTQAWATGRHAKGFDYIHVHGDFLEAWVALRLAKRIGAVPVWTIHGKLSDDHRHRTARAAREFPAVIAVSSAIRDQLVGDGYEGDNLEIIPSGVEPRLRNAVRPTRSGSTRIAFVGALSHQKGIDLLCDAVMSLPRLPVLVEVLGEGPLRHFLRKRTDSRFTFRGRVPEADVEAALLRSDIAVFPSRDMPGKGEGTPTALLEALAAGCAVIAAGVGGIPPLLEQSNAGIVFPPEDVHALAAAIERLCSDAIAMSKLGARGRRSARPYEWPAAVDRIMEVYSRAVPRWTY